MTPQQKAEYEQDMQDFRDRFIKDLARELASEVVQHWSTRLSISNFTTEQIAERLLDKHLPGALEVQYPTIEDQSRR